MNRADLQVIRIKAIEERKKLIIDSIKKDYKNLLENTAVRYYDLSGKEVRNLSVTWIEEFQDHKILFDIDLLIKTIIKSKPKKRRNK